MANYKVKHLGLIPDGAGRWASARGDELVFGYRVSVDLIKLLMKRYFEEGGFEFSIYLFSVSNFKRKDWEIDALMQVADEFISWLVNEQESIGLSVVIAGNRDLLPSNVNSTIAKLENRLPYNRTLNLLLAYDPIDELNFATNIDTACKGDNFLDCLWVKTPVDLVLRTGGAKTLSKFLPLQCAHARLIFLDKLLNDLSVDDLLKYVHEHESLDLQYGD